MINITYLPVFVTQLFRGMPGIWKHQHRQMWIGLMVMQALFPGRKTVVERARWTPIDITEWPFRRWLKATYWDVHRLIDGWAHPVMTSLPPPEEGILTLTGERRNTPNRGKQNPASIRGSATPMTCIIDAKWPKCPYNPTLTPASTFEPVSQNCPD